MLNGTAFEYMTNLQYKVKGLTAQVEAFKSGEAYRRLESHYGDCLASKDRVIKKLKLELAEVRLRYTDVRNNWQEVMEDIEKEHTKELKQKDREVRALQKQLWDAQNIIDGQKEKLLLQKRELYQAQTELEDEKGKVLKLKAQINRDYENSGIPSSMKPNRKKITNNREKTGRKPGGQPGHKGHGRKRHEPTFKTEIPPLEKHLKHGFKETGRVITKQLVDIKVNLVVHEYSTPEFRNLATGQRVHAPFPESLVNEVTYGGSVKAFAFLLNNRCNVSILKATSFISEITGGELKLSAGMINGLSKNFSEQTEAEQKKAFADMLLAPVMYVDFTTARVDGKNRNVLVCANKDNVIYFAKEHKGHKGVKWSPIETYQGIMVHDHDKTFYSYGSDHQECLEHVRRYLKGSMVNEPNLTWNGQMRQLINEMMAFKRDINPDESRSPDIIDAAQVASFVRRYDEILKLAETEYEYEPPNKYYMVGYNLYKRLLVYRHNHLLFLFRNDLDPTNNLSERLLRNFKRKMKQAMSFRSDNGLDFLCNSLGIIASFIYNGKNLYESVAEILSPAYLKSVKA